MSYTFIVAGVKKKAAVGGGEVSGVVDRWRNGDGIAIDDPAPLGITPLVYLTLGETGITPGDGVGFMPCPGF